MVNDDEYFANQVNETVRVNNYINYNLATKRTSTIEMNYFRLYMNINVDIEFFQYCFSLLNKY